MRLSVLIPMYNAKTYIGNCIESLLNQNIPEQDYEIIIIDDGSTDNSIEIVGHYLEKHQNIRLIKAANSGAYTTRNKLLKLAQGNYIYNLDADDYIVHNCLKDLLTIAEQNLLDIIGFKTKETKSLTELEIDEPISIDRLKIQTGKTFIENYPLMRHELWWYFVSRDFLKQNSFSFNSNQYNADVLFTLKALVKADKVGYVDSSIHRYVQSEDSIMRSSDIEVAKKRMGYMQMMIINKSKLINELKSTSSSKILISNLSHRRDVFTFFNLIKMIRSGLSSKEIKKSIDNLRDVEAYPIKDFNKHSYNTLQYRILRKIMNTESILYLMVSVKRLFSKSA